MITFEPRKKERYDMDGRRIINKYRMGKDLYDCINFNYHLLFTTGELDKAYESIGNKVNSMTDSLYRFVQTPIISNKNDKENVDPWFENELKTFNYLIRMLKGFYESGYDNLIDDDLYDAFILKYTQFEIEPIEYMRSPLIEHKEIKDEKISHDFPLLQGTLRKTHYIRYGENIQAIDTIEKLIDDALSITSNLSLRISFKYDGTSCTFTISPQGKILKAVTRGEEGQGIDLTKLFDHIHFNNRTGKVIGLQTELMMDKANIHHYSMKKNYKYVNSRVAVTSILRALDGYKYVNHISPVPLKVSTGENNIADYNTGIPYISETFLCDNKFKILNWIENYIEKVLKDRPCMPFDIDGVVITILNKEVVEKLGRTGNVNNYEVAYKFPSTEAPTTVTDVQFTVGKTGQITPVLHFENIIFNGTNQTKCSLGSMNIFRKANISIGDRVMISYRNDVIPHYERTIMKSPNPIINEPDYCPSCGINLDRTSEGELFCNNFNCFAKNIGSYEYFLKQIGIKGYSSSFIEKLFNSGYRMEDGKIGLLIHQSVEPFVGDVFGYNSISYDKYMRQVSEITHKSITESQLGAAYMLDGKKTCKTIFSRISLRDLCRNPEAIFSVEIPKVKEKVKRSFIDNLYRAMHNNDIQRAIQYLSPIPEKLEEQVQYDTKVRFTGFRDKDLILELNKLGCAVVDSYSNIVALVVPNMNYSNSKTEECIRRGIPIIPKDDIISFIATTK